MSAHSNDTIQAAVVLSTRLLLQLQGVTFQGGASAFGAAGAARFLTIL